VADVMREICGDGHDLHYYGCDDGNLVNGDGCSSVCAIEAGWDCDYGDYFHADVCWPLNRPLIIDGAIS
jgi:cysteine-rich repeat protein